MTAAHTDMGGDETIGEEKTQNTDLFHYIGPIAMYKKNAERDYWLNDALNEVFSSDRVFTKMENNSTSV